MCLLLIKSYATGLGYGAKGMLRLPFHMTCIKDARGKESPNVKGGILTLPIFLRHRSLVETVPFWRRFTNVPEVHLFFDLSNLKPGSALT